MLTDFFAKVVRYGMRRLSPLLPFDARMQIVRQMLHDCGFGSGAPLSTSNEEAAFALIHTATPLVFDVGAHTGEYTALVKRHFPAATVHGFEPSMQHFALLQQTTAALDRVTLNRLALGKEEGEATLYRDQAVSGLASLTKRQLAHYAIAMDMEETVQLATVDRYVARHGIARIDLMKIDVEGHEMDVLAGAAETLAAGRIAVVQFEFGGSNLDTRTTLRDFFFFFTAQHAFDLFVITPRGLAPIAAYNEIYEQYSTANFLAVRRH